MKEFRVHGILEESHESHFDPRKPPFVSFYRGSRVSELALG